MSNLHGYALAGLNLVSFDLAAPNISLTSLPIAGLTAGETLVGIDFRPVNGLLYGLGVNAGADTATLYVISTRTGVAGAVGSIAGVGDLPPGNFGFDFNPSVDRIRVTTDTGLNFRLNPNSGAIAGVDTSIPEPPDIPAYDVSGVAYTNNRPDNGDITTLYALDALSDFLNVQFPPNGGDQNPVGPLGVDFSNANGFDIPRGVDAPANGTVTSGTGYALLTVAGTVGLYGVDLLGGAATLVGTFLDGVTPTGGFAIQNDFAGIPAVALSADGTTLVRFDSAAPATLAGNAISGIGAGETLVAIDYRPLTGELYGLAVDAAADTGTLYLLQVGGGAATAVGVPGGIAFVSGGAAVDLPAGGYGMDFNPTVDRIRITTESGLNFRLNPNDGAPVDGDVVATGTNPDIAINGLPAGSTGVSATAYTNSFGQLPGGPTTQYTLDSASDTLFIQNSNFGTLSAPHAVTLDGSPLDFASVNGFDIPSGVAVAVSGSPAFGFGLAALTVAGTTSLYAINLGTGAAIDLGAIGTGADGLAGLSLGAPPALRSGSAGADGFVAFGGSERIDAGIGTDTVTFGFKLTDATVTHLGNAVIIDTVSSHTVLTGVDRFVFNDGTVDNDDGNVLVDDLFYYAHNHDVWAAQVDADQHFDTFGWREGRDPDAFFSVSTYLSAYPDVRAAGVNPLTHWRDVGWTEGRLPSIRFDPAQYLAANPDVDAANINPLLHFLQSGAAELLQPFAPARLVTANAFDYVFYLSNNPDVAAAGVDPFGHFMTHGWTEGRNPNALFDVNGYLSNYLDVDAANVNPLTHYDEFGWREGRDPSVNFDTTSYLAAYPDVAAANVNPFVHFLQFGADEGRSAFADGVWG